MKDLPPINPAFHQYNEGDKLIVCFHGYGQRAAIFKMLSNMLKGYEFLAIDLPFHNVKNNSIANDIDQLYFSFKEYIINRNFKEINIIGYSIGARLAIYFYQKSPNIFKNIYLIAPDGVDKNPLFPIVTNTYAAPLFRFIMSKHKVIHNCVSYLSKINLITKNQYRFAIKSLTSSQDSVQVAETWIALRNTTFNNKKLFTLITKNNTKLFLVVGNQDKIITRKRVSHLSKFLPQPQVLYFDANHYQVLINFFYWFKEKKTP